MNAERLLEHYEKIAEAPDAIPKLRRFILDLAVRGKLVPQDPNDEPAEELLKRIEAEKKRLINEGVVKPDNKKASGKKQTEDVDLPCGWAATQLAFISNRIHYGYTASADAAIRNVRLLRITDIQDNSVNWDSVPGCIIDSDDVGQYQLVKGDILIARTGGTIGKTFLVSNAPVTAVFASYLIRLQPTKFVYDRYLKSYFESSLYWDQLRDGSRGTGQPNVNGQTLGGLFVPLPPLAEQQRIVAKVDELMGICDRLEVARKEREAIRDGFTTSTLGRLSVADESTFRSDASFAIEHLRELTTRPDQIKQLRQTILNLAVRGKLVPQDPNDEPASELLKRIAASNREFEKSLFRNKGETKNNKLPKGWVLTSVGNVASIEMGQSPPGSTYNQRGDGIPLINGPVEFSDGPFGITVLNQYTTKPTKICNAGDFLICVRGSTTGKTNIAGYQACIGRGVAAIRSHFDDSYLRLFLWSYREQIISMGRGIAFPSVSRKQLEDLPLPLPPLSEQHRIVARVEKLIGLCQNLESTLAIANNNNNKVLSGLLIDSVY
jgi:type I restriction enzyme S subunit